MNAATYAPALMMLGTTPPKTVGAMGKALSASGHGDVPVHDFATIAALMTAWNKADAAPALEVEPNDLGNADRIMMFAAKADMSIPELRRAISVVQARLEAIDG